MRLKADAPSILHHYQVYILHDYKARHMNHAEINRINILAEQNLHASQLHRYLTMPYCHPEVFYNKCSSSEADEEAYIHDNLIKITGEFTQFSAKTIPNDIVIYNNGKLTSKFNLNNEANIQNWNIFVENSSNKVK